LRAPSNISHGELARVVIHGGGFFWGDTEIASGFHRPPPPFYHPRGLGAEKKGLLWGKIKKVKKKGINIRKKKKETAFLID
jgi:hypothetical protein